KRQESRGSENHEARWLQVVVVPSKRNNEEAKANDRSDEGKMIQYQVEVRQIHEGLLKRL
ncbi:MAG: hypothetical protein DMF92_08820, partial [Acidobacteria bacterium]